MAPGAKAIGRILVESFKGFLDDEPFRLAAALSYYSLLSMAPLLLIVVAVAGFFFGTGAVQAEIVEQLRSLVGDAGASVAQTVIRNAGEQHSDVLSFVVGAALTLLGATTVFAQLQAALNRIWGVEAKPLNAVWSFIRHRLLSFALILSIGFLLMVSLILSAVLAALHAYLERLMPGMATISELLNTAISFGLAILLVAMIFKYLPDTVIEWRDTWLGALITSSLFVAGKFLIGLYLGQASIGSVFGAAGSVVVFMVWVYFASLIFFLGAEITQAVAKYRGAAIVPSEHARFS